MNEQSTPKPATPPATPAAATPAADTPPHSVMERIAALETKVDAMNTALTRAFGQRWIDELKPKP